MTAAIPATGAPSTYFSRAPASMGSSMPVGLYAVLITSHDHSRAARAEILDNFIATVLRSVEAR
ncbi:MAG TPA: hypothetical protein VHZ03_24930 [Trebonia sp.]|nr:hypothetical protein [Trebonia sp.]